MTYSPKRNRHRSPAEIIRLLQNKQSRKHSTAEFCQQHGISHQTFYNWIKKFGSQPPVQNDFIPLLTSAHSSSDATVFCEITQGKTTLRFFAPVDAAYLKSLMP